MSALMNLWGVEVGFQAQKCAIPDHEYLSITTAKSLANISVIQDEKSHMDRSQNMVVQVERGSWALKACFKNLPSWVCLLGKVRRWIAKPCSASQVATPSAWNVFLAESGPSATTNGANRIELGLTCRQFEGCDNISNPLILSQVGRSLAHLFNELRIWNSDAPYTWESWRDCNYWKISKQTEQSALFCSLNAVAVQWTALRHQASPPKGFTQEREWTLGIHLQTARLGINRIASMISLSCSVVWIDVFHKHCVRQWANTTHKWKCSPRCNDCRLSAIRILLCARLQLTIPYADCQLVLRVVYELLKQWIEHVVVAQTVHWERLGVQLLLWKEPNQPTNKELVRSVWRRHYGLHQCFPRINPAFQFPSSIVQEW